MSFVYVGTAIHNFRWIKKDKSNAVVCFSTDKHLTSVNLCLYLQGEGELQVGLCQPCWGQQDLIGAQDPLGALSRRQTEERRRENTKERTSWGQGRKAGKDGKITVSVAWLTPAESKQWTVKRGSKGGRGKREVKRRKLTDRKEQREKIEQRGQQQHGRRIKTA